MRWCSTGAHQTTVADCTNERGLLQASCQECLARRRQRHAEVAAAAAAVNAAADAAAEQAVANDADANPALHGLDEDEFDLIFGDGAEYMNIQLPDDSVLNAREAGLMANFEEALNNIKLESCDTCYEESFDMKLVERQCASCRNDKCDP